MCDKKEVKRIYSKIGSLLCSSRLNNNYYAQTILRIIHPPQSKLFYPSMLACSTAISYFWYSVQSRKSEKLPQKYCTALEQQQGTSINDVPCFLTIFDLPTYLVLLYNVRFWGLSWTPLPTLISDVINGLYQTFSFFNNTVLLL